MMLHARYAALFVLTFCAVQLSAATTISLFAGGKTSGFAGDGGPALSAQFSGAEGLAIDSAGNLYVCDELNHRIRKISTSGIVSTIAGTGTAGFSGDGGLATAAQLNGPSSIAINSSGVIYFTDEENNRVRQIDLAGMISTIAGDGQPNLLGINGPASAASVSQPNYIALDGLGRVHFASQNRVLGIDGGILLAIAGTETSGFSGDGGPAASAQLNDVAGLAFDSLDNMVIVDLANQRLRRVDTGGIITTIAGTGTAGFSGDGGPALNAQLGFPGDGLLIDRFDNIYFGDYGVDEQESRLRRIDPAGVITTIAGTGKKGFPANGADPLTSSYFGVSGIVADAAGDVYVTFNSDVDDGERDFGSGVYKISFNVPSIVQNPDNGLGIEVLRQTGGLVELSVNADTLIRAPFTLTTDFSDFPGRQTAGVLGGLPAHQYIQAGLFVATSTAVDDANGLTAGKMRKTLAVSRANTGESALVTAQPNSREIRGFQLKGKFLFTDTKPDAVTFSGSIELPAGLDLSQPQSVSFSVGNVSDTVSMDAKGKASLPSEKSIVKKASIKYPKPSNGTLTGTGQTAKLSLQFSLADLDVAGFDTEGITPAARQRDPLAKSYPRAIQCAVLIAGVAYELKAPVAFKLSKGNESGQLQGRSAAK